MTIGDEASADDGDLFDFLSGDSETSAQRPELTPLRDQLSAPTLAVAMAAVAEIARDGRGELQAEVVELLTGRLDEMGHGDIEHVLDCLAAIGDGRCVRGMERLLVQGWQSLSEHQAWRTRHIIQVIRRGGRK